MATRTTHGTAADAARHQTGHPAAGSEASGAAPTSRLVARPRGGCPACGSTSVTELSMVLTDGTPVTFTSCRSCEHRHWEADGAELRIGDVLDRTRR